MTQATPDSPPTRPLVMALVTLLVIGLGTGAVYDYGWHHGVSQDLRNVMGPVSFGVLMGGGGVLLALATWLGHRFWRGLAWAAVIPVAWLIKESLLVLELHGWAGLTFSLQGVAFLAFLGFVTAAASLLDALALLAAWLAGRPAPGPTMHVLLPLLCLACFTGAYLLVQTYVAAAP